MPPTSVLARIVLRDVIVMLVNAKVREHVSVRAGYAIQAIDRKAAEENA